MKRCRCCVVLIVGFAVFASAAVAQNPASDLEKELPVLQHMPKDPLMVWAGDVGMASSSFDSLLATVRKFLDDDERSMLDAKLVELDEELGFNLRDDLLAHLGPQMAAVADLPPIDAAAGPIMAGSPDGIGQALGRIALWMEVDDSAAVARALGKLTVLAEAETETTDGVVRLWWPQAESGDNGMGTPPPPSLYYTIENGIMAVGFDADRVASLVKPAAADSRLTAGDDFQKVLQHLDQNPRTLTYVNLPHLQLLVRESQLVMGMAAGNEEMGPVLEVLLDPDLATSGIGATTREVGSGVRQVAYGPAWMSGGAGMVGIVTAIAVPNMLNAIDRGRQKRTMADIRAWGSAIEDHAAATGSYPVTDGWVACDGLAGVLDTDSLPSMPAVDGWLGPLQCFSDGLGYRIVSGGKGGALEGDYSGVVDFEVTQNFSADIVFVDGSFAVYPEGVQVD